MRSTITLPSATLTLAAGWCSSVSLPLGPSNEIVRPLIASFTVLGRGIGFFPMRLIELSFRRQVSSAFVSGPSDFFNSNFSFVRLRTFVSSCLSGLSNRRQKLAADVLRLRLPIRQHPAAGREHRDAQARDHLRELLH